MPELPEVEVIKKGLEKRIIGLKIQKIQVVSPKSFIGNPNLAERQTVLKLWRRAKILGVELSGNVTLLFHLKMSGQLIYEDEKRFIGGHPTNDMLGKMPNPHTRVIFSFSDGSHLYFNDMRRFGWVKVVQSSKLNPSTSLGTSVESEKILGKLGPEPLEKEFSWQVLKENLLKHKEIPVKVAIMDQSVVSGVGNIYANEACFLARLDPKTRVGELKDEQFKALYKGIIKALEVGIKYGGSTKVHFLNAEGKKGYFLDYAYVYGRDKMPCKVCGTEIKKITLGGRGTYFCSHDQK